MGEEEPTIRELVGRIDERLKVVEKFVYGISGTVGVGLLVTLLALVTRQQG